MTPQALVPRLLAMGVSNAVRGFFIGPSGLFIEKIPITLSRYSSHNLPHYEVTVDIRITHHG
ncbi:MAG TPA: hypothetical protein VFB79_04870 [Candidatus Angelobacter sp.]|nr:hypothetical protein [Candidatus Angelobacter sp.]